MPLKWNGPAVIQRVREAARHAVEAGAKLLQIAVKKNLNKGGSSNRSGPMTSGGKDLGKKTGTLGRSITVRAIEQNGSITRTTVGTNVVYAKIHEFGGVISARGKALTIPISRKAKAASEAKVRPQQAFPDSFIIKTKTGALIVRDTARGKSKITSVPKSGKGKAPSIGPMRKPTVGNRSKGNLSYALVKIGDNWKKLEVLYSLVRSVRIPARPYFRPAVAEVSGKIREQVRAVFRARMGAR